jgi:hypothetical protein
MPGTWPDIERLSHTKYQIVMPLTLLSNRPWSGWSPSIFCCDLPIFVIHCTGPGTFHFLSTEEREPGLSPSARENNLWKQLLRDRRLKRISLSDAEKLTQAEG